LVNLPEVARRPFIEALKHSIDQTRAEKSNLGLLLVDIGNLAKINHYYGYDQGDLMLSVAAEQLVGVSRLPDTVFRIGSHHFAFILPGLTNPGFIALAINKVAITLGQDMSIGDDMVPVKINIGVAIGRRGEFDAMTMLGIAEASLAHVRSGGAHQIHELVEESAGARQDFELEKLFRETLNDNDFQLCYQPKINMRTGAADHAEALLRWQLPDGDFISPEQAVQLAESMGSGYALTKWVVHTALRQLKAWQQGGINMSVAVNIQASLVSSPDLLALIEDTIAIWGVEESWITLEITETAIIEDKESGFNNLLKLKNLGVALSIDDFGTGYSSMAYFKHIPASELKIDRYFVSSMKDDELDRELVRIMINTAHLFGLSVVAEGVEDQESLELLREMDCDYAQGYFFTRPLPVPEFEDWLKSWPGL
jgi:diguanylate cyclase (GGDEF)-like protein